MQPFRDKLSTFFQRDPRHPGGALHCAGVGAVAEGGLREAVLVPRGRQDKVWAGVLRLQLRHTVKLDRVINNSLICSVVQ